MQISTFAFDICTYHFKDAYVIAVIYIYITHTKLYLYNDYTTTVLKTLYSKIELLLPNILTAAYDDKVKRRRKYNLSIIIFYKNEIF